MMISLPNYGNGVVKGGANQTCFNFNNNIYSNVSPDHMIDETTIQKGRRDIQAEIQRSIEGVKS